MKALVYHGRYDVRVDTVPDPVIEQPRDAIIKVTSTAICGSDLHLYDGYIPAMEKGDILGHEFMGEVVEVGKDNKKLKVGDRVVVPFNICCGECFFCLRGQWSCCERTNRDADKATKMFGHNTAGLFGYSHLTGHYPGGQAEYVRVPFADVCPTKVPEGLTDEQVLFLTDIFPTGFQGAKFAEIEDWRHRRRLGLRPCWAVLLFVVLRCWARVMSLPSTWCQSDWLWPRQPARKLSILRRRTCTNASTRSQRDGGRTGALMPLAWKPMVTALGIQSPIGPLRRLVGHGPLPRFARLSAQRSCRRYCVDFRCLWWIPQHGPAWCRVSERRHHPDGPVQCAQLYGRADDGN